MNLFFATLYTAILVSCSSSNIKDTTTTMDLVPPLDTSIHPTIALDYQFNWQDSFSKTITTPYTSAVIDHISNPNQLQTQAEKELKYYPYLKHPYIYDAFLHKLYKVASPKTVHLFFDFNSFITPQEQVIDLILDAKENCYLLSTSSNNQKAINYIKKISPTGKLLFKYSQSIDAPLAWSNGKPTFYTKFIFFQENLYILGKDSQKSQVYNINSQSGKMTLFYETTKEVHSIQATLSEIILITTDAQSIAIPPSGNATPNKNIDLQEQTTILAIDQKNRYYAYYDELVRLENTSSQSMDLLSIVPFQEDLYYQLHLAQKENNHRGKVTIYKNGAQEALTFSFPFQSIPHYTSLTLVKISHNKAYFIAGKHLNDKLYIFDLKHKRLVDQQVYQPLTSPQNYMLQYNCSSWAIKEDGTLLIPVQSPEAFWIFSLTYP